MRADTQNWIESDYPDDIRRALQDYSEEVVGEYLNKTAEIIQWLKSRPNLTASSRDSAES